MDGDRYITSTSSPAPWPEKGPKEKWKVEEDPATGTRIWIIAQGKRRGKPHQQRGSSSRRTKQTLGSVTSRPWKKPNGRSSNVGWSPNP
eukprot:8229791-Lingulodinium_polyedra.AAC.1